MLKVQTETQNQGRDLVGSGLGTTSKTIKGGDWRIIDNKCDLETDGLFGVLNL